MATRPKKAGKLAEKKALETLIEKARTNAQNYCDEISKWCKDTEQALAFQGLGQVERTCKELVRLAHCVNLGGRWFGKRLLVSQEQAAELSQFQTDAAMDAALQKGFPAFDDGKFVKDPQNVTVTIPATEPAADLLPFFAIVRKIHVDVEISRRLGDYYGLTGRQLLFSDCPGFNAEDTMARDHALCLLEMEAVDCVLSLVKSDEFAKGSPFNDIAYKKWGDAREKTILGVSQFDKFTTNDPGWPTLDELLDKDGLLAEETVLQTLQNSLGKLYRFSENNAQRDAVVFYSSFAFICRCASLFKPTKKVTNICNNDGGLEANLSKWRRVAEKLPEDSRLRAILDGYVSDGGGLYLVGRLLDIVEQKTGAQRARLEAELRYCEQNWQDLKQDVETAATEQAEPGAPEFDDDPTKDEDWNRTLKTLQKLQRWLAPFANTIPAEFKKVFDENFESLRERAAQNAGYLIHAVMPDWETLFRSIDANDFTIPRESEQEAQNTSRRSKKTTNADPLRQKFEQLLKALWGEIRTFPYSNAERARMGLTKKPKPTIVDKAFEAYVRKTLEQERDLFPSEYELCQLFAQMNRAKLNPELSEDARRNAEDFCNFYNTKCKGKSLDATRLPLLFENLMEGCELSRPVDAFSPNQSSRTFAWAYELWSEAQRRNKDVADKHRHLMMLSELRASYEESAVYFARGNFNLVKTHYIKRLKERGVEISQYVDDAIAVCYECLRQNSVALDGSLNLGGLF